MKKLNESFVFFTGYIKNPGRVGTIFKSSRSMAKTIANEVNGAYIVEFGAGTGIISKEILKKIGKYGKLICFETDKKYCRYIEETLNDEVRSGRLEVICDDATNYVKYVDKVPDTIVSGLPLASLNKTIVYDVLKKSSNVDRFIQYQYSPFSTLILGKFFKKIKVKRIMKNIIPATMYICSEGKYR